MPSRFSASVSVDAMHNANHESLLKIIEGHSTLDGRFTEIRRIGQSGGSGNFSLLFSARDLTTGRRVALKFYHPERRHDSYRAACFEREETILCELNGQHDIIGWVGPRSYFLEPFRHPSGFTFDLDFTYYALELAISDTSSMIARSLWSSTRCLEAFRTMCRSVQRLHSQSIVHRDLKPGNFLITRNRQVKLSDFGTARRITEKIPPLLLNYPTAPGDIRYSSPEMLAGLHDQEPTLAFAGDIYSLGAILFELLTGVNLGVLALGWTDINDLIKMMSLVPGAERRRIYEGFVGQLETGHPLPSISSYTVAIPDFVVKRLDTLYQSMSSVDYRIRNVSFESIFRQLNWCIIALRNEQAYRRWLEQRRRRQEAKRMKMLVRGGGQ